MTLDVRVELLLAARSRSPLRRPSAASSEAARDGQDGPDQRRLPPLAVIDEVDVAGEALTAHSEGPQAAGRHLVLHDGRRHEAHAVAHLHGTLDHLVGADFHGRLGARAELDETALDELASG